jgi:acetamidase/formamidase
MYFRLDLERDQNKLTGKLDGEAFEGMLEGICEGDRITGIVKPNPGMTIQLQGTLLDDYIEGTGTVLEDKLALKWEARRQEKRSTVPKTHEFEPTQFHHFFSAAIEPVLRMNPGDSIKTWSVDSRGMDSQGVRRTLGGNPLTGPFYVEGAFPGDTLLVHFDRIELNRESAVSGSLIVNGALDTSYIETRGKLDHDNSDWKLDLEGGFASVAEPTESLKNYKVPLAPMLGCVGVAPAEGMRSRSRYLGAYGGNMDYNQVRSGVTVYLPVFVPGALLFVGDGHAVQGAGELIGSALETSMAIEFTVDLEKGGAPSNPRMASAEYLMASGIAGSLDDALRGATSNLARWIEKIYGLGAAEVSLVLGTSISFDIAEVVDPQLHVVARIPKALLHGLNKPDLTSAQN